MKFKSQILRLLFFIALFSAIDFVYLFTDYFESDYDSLTIAIMDSSVGYNNLYYIVGIVVTIIFIVSLNRDLLINSSALVIRIGKIGYMKYFLKKSLVKAILISAEFVIAEVFVCTIRFKSELLIETGFYQCCILYIISLFAYFAVVGIFEVLVNIILNFNKISCVITIALFVALNSLILCGADISPVYFSEFISEWFQYGSFNYFEYILNILKCLCCILIVFFVVNIIFQRKDLIFDEQEN